MSINVGRRANGALSLSLSDKDLDRAHEEWGDTQSFPLRLRWTLASTMPGRYRLVFFPCQLGNMPHAYRPGGGDLYVAWNWHRRDELATIQDMAAIRDGAVEWHSWEGGSLIVEVRRQPKSRENYFREPHVRPPKQKLPLRKKEPTVAEKITAEYRLRKSTSGAHCYEVASGETGLGSLYIRKSVFGDKLAPRGLLIELTPVK